MGNRQKLIIAFILMLSILSCRDSFELSITNNTDYDTELALNTLENPILVKAGENRLITLKKATSDIVVSCQNDLYHSEYRFQDVDHWFGVNHEIQILITADGLVFKGTRNEKFKSVTK